MLKHRLFIAIPIGDKFEAYLKDELEKLDFSFSDSDIEKWHITTLFLGEIHTSKIEEIKHAMNELCRSTQTFNLVPKSIEVKSQKSGEMLWVTFLDSAEFVSVSEGFASELNYELTKKPLPHVTLLRSKKKIKGDLPNKIQFSPIEVTEIQLWESNLSSNGATYSCLASFNLQ